MIEDMSKIRHRMLRADQYDAPGSIEYMGTNWDRMVEENSLSENEDMAARLLYQLNEMIPADILQMWDAMDGASEE